MKVIGDYHEHGYAHLEGLIAPEVAQAFLQGLKQDLGPAPIPLSTHGEQVNLLNRPTFQAYSHYWKPMGFFLWGLTPAISEIVGRDLLPTYDYFRIYRSGDICKVHADRLSCEHSVSLTLGYSDDKVWPLEIGRTRQDPNARIDEDFGAEEFGSVPMRIGDAVLYQGVHHRHGRTIPNPNRWSAHLFLHWVDRDGPYADQAFDGRLDPAKVDFAFS